MRRIVMNWLEFGDESPSPLPGGAARWRKGPPLLLQGRGVRGEGAAAILALLLLPALLVGQQGVKVNFSDRANNLTLSGFASWLFNSDAEGGMTFDGTGNPATGESRSQNLRIDGKTWKGTAQKQADGKTYLLQIVTVTGNVKAVSKREDGEVTLLAPTLRYAAPANRFDVEGGVSVTQVQAKSTLFARGATAAIVLYEKKPKDTPSTIRTATMTGPVHVELRSEREVVEGEKKLMRAYTVVADAGRMEYDAAARTVILTGGVKVVGDDTVMAGDATGSRAVIRLDADGRPISLEMTGEPGVTHFNERRGGGGR